MKIERLLFFRMLLEQWKILQQFPYDLLFLLDKQNSPRILLISNCCCGLKCVPKNSHGEA
jgi:hypothetical protein